MFVTVLTNFSTISTWILMKLGMHVQWTSHIQGSKLLGSRMSRTPKNGDGNPILGPGFPTGIFRVMDSLKLGFSGRKPRNCWGNPNTVEVRLVDAHPMWTSTCCGHCVPPEAGFPNGNPNFNRNF